MYTCVATSGAQREEAQTRILPQEDPEDTEGQWEELTLVEEEGWEGVQDRPGRSETNG